jgi:site-specific recombinase XerD
MLPARASATTPEPPARRQSVSPRRVSPSWATTSQPAALLAAYQEYLRRRGGRSAAYWSGARAFFARWPDPALWAREPLTVRLSASDSTRPLITFLMLHGLLHPGYDYLLERKLVGLWGDLVTSPFEPDLTRFLATANQLGFSAQVGAAAGSQVPARLLIQTGRRLDRLRIGDLEDFEQACRDRQDRTGTGWRHYQVALLDTHLVLFHLGILPDPPLPAVGPVPFTERLREVREPIRASLVAYLERKQATCVTKTVSSLASRLTDFGRFLAVIDPGLTSLAGLDRRRHIEPYLTWLVHAPNSKHDGEISIAERARRVLAVTNLLADITAWGWPEAPTRQVIFRDDVPRLPRLLPRYLPHDVDRRLQDALTEHPDNQLAAHALLLQRACGLRIGELLDLELDCVHEVPGNGAWLKVPLGKLDRERMIPLDPETVTLIDQITEIRSPGRALPHPRYHRPAQFLFTHHGRRLSSSAVRHELDHAAVTAGLDHLKPHQLRHTWATTLVNAGVSLQALMALLGHVSAEMSLRYGHLFDTTVRAEYDRALSLAKQRLTACPGATVSVADLTGGLDWRTSPLIKTRLAGGFCLRATSQGPCAHANICENCPSFHTEPANLAALTAQREDTQTLADDATTRGWTAETERHQALLARLDLLLNQADAG